MSEAITEKPTDSVETVDTTTVESTTTTEHGETHLADGTLLEEMKNAVKQGAFNFFLFCYSIKVMFHLAHLFFSWVKKKVEFYFADANLPYDKCTRFFWFPLFLLC
jgi:hypothetical protein